MKKKCSKCKEEKKLSFFTKKKDGKYGVYSQCKKCVSNLKKTKEYRDKTNAHKRSLPRTSDRKKMQRERSRKFRATNKGASMSLSYNLKKYGITLEEYNLMFINQNGCCKICDKHQNDLTRKLAVDHCHKSGEIRGLLCSTCNAALGSFNDDEYILKKAIKYLKGE